VQTPKEIARIQRQLDEADVVVAFDQGPLLTPWQWNEFAQQRRNFVESWRGTYLVIYERIRQ
jgi:hypothetical protein